MKILLLRIRVPDIEGWYYKIKWFWQRGRRGYADCDVWGLDHYLANLVPLMLKRLRETRHGYPGYGSANTPEKWDAIIDKMIEGWLAAKRVCEDEYFRDTNDDILERKPTHIEVQLWGSKSKKDQKKFNSTMKLFTKYFFHLWD